MANQNAGDRAVVVADNASTVNVLVTAHTYNNAIKIEPEHIKCLKTAFEYCKGWIHLDAALKGYGETTMEFVIRNVPQKDYINRAREFVRTADKVMQAICNYDDKIKNRYFHVSQVSYEVI